MIINEDDYLAHYGTPRHSGRYPWGSGGNVDIANKRNKQFMDYVTDMKNSRIQVFDKDFNFKHQWGSFGNGTGQFSGTIPGIDLYEKENLVLKCH